MEWTKFLETIPPGIEIEVENMLDKETFSGELVISYADIELHCDSGKCQGMRFFGTGFGDTVKIASRDRPSNVLLTYYCRNCGDASKIFALRINPNKDDSTNGKAIKIGELPPFGPIIPSRLIKLIGPDREIFLKGRRAEIQGLGIGAFSYYRRIVENQKGRLLSKTRDVAKRLGATTKTLSKFDEAIQEPQFTKAIENVRDVIPESLLIEGHNPLMLLHRALSEGMHAKTDEECLSLATSIRVILTELSEHISLVLKDEAEIKQALSTLLNRNKNSSSEQKEEIDAT